MEERYYTPELSEFRVGFHFEVAYGGNLNDWYKMVFKEEDLLHGLQTLHETYRVKCLDIKDILAEGWREVISRKEFSKNPYFLANDDGEIRIYDTHLFDQMYNEEWTMLFKGEIKNCSELNFLMKRLGII